MASPKKPKMLRGWALLHYLSEKRDSPEECKNFSIQRLLRANYNQANEIIQDSISKGFVKELEDHPKCYTITEKGYEHLLKLRDVLSIWHDKEVQGLTKQTKTM
jgi:predicted transcriptional regulator